MAQGDIPTSPGGPFRRRKEKRQLEQLAVKAAVREPGPIDSHSHVSVIEDQIALEGGEPEGQAPDARPERSGDTGRTGFHVHPVPIDQPIEKR
jgi:hypothetical protein